MIKERQCQGEEAPRQVVMEEWVEQGCWVPGGCVSCSVTSDSLWPYGLQPVRLRHPWNSPGKNTGVGCDSSPGDLPDPGIKPGSPTLRADSLPSELPEDVGNQRCLKRWIGCLVKHLDSPPYFKEKTFFFFFLKIDLKRHVGDSIGEAGRNRRQKED